MQQKLLILRGKAIDSRLLVSLAWLEHRCGEPGLVRSIGMTLTLETKALALLIDLFILTGKRSLKEVAGVELNAVIG